MLTQSDLPLSLLSGALPHFSERISFAIGKVTDAVTDALAGTEQSSVVYRRKVDSVCISLPPSLATYLSPYLPSYFLLRSTLLFLQFSSYSPPFLPFLEPHRLHSPFSSRPSLALPLYFTHISRSSPPLDVNPGDPLFVELLPLIRENLPKKLAEVAWDRVESKFPVQYQVGRSKKIFLTLTR